jgi:hypothetical protein
MQQTFGHIAIKFLSDMSLLLSMLILPDKKAAPWGKELKEQISQQG